VRHHFDVVQKMNRITTSTYWTATFGVWCFGALYLAAMLVAPDNGLQVTGMLGMKPGSGISILYGWIYTGLFALSLRRYPWLISPTQILSGVVLGLTIFPLSHSLLHDFRPGFYENYVGETLTIIALLLLCVAASFTKPNNKAAQQVAS
jgi:hypothetical protein